jgi:hypothetical protein
MKTKIQFSLNSDDSQAYEDQKWEEKAKAIPGFHKIEIDKQGVMRAVNKVGAILSVKVPSVKTVRKYKTTDNMVVEAPKLPPDLRVNLQSPTHTTITDDSGEGGTPLVYNTKKD